MRTLFLSVLPLGVIVASFAYTAVLGVRRFRSTGALAVLSVAGVLLGLALGHILDAMLRSPRALEDWIDYQIGTRLDRYILVASVETTLLLLLVAAMAVLWATMIIRESDYGADESGKINYGLCVGTFFCAIGITARAKLAAYVTLALVQAHVL